MDMYVCDFNPSTSLYRRWQEKQSRFQCRLFFSRRDLISSQFMLKFKDVDKLFHLPERTTAVIPLQLTKFTWVLQAPAPPHRVDEGPLSWYPWAQVKEQVDPYFWVEDRQCEGETCTPLSKESFWHLTNNQKRDNWSTLTCMQFFYS